MNWPRNGDSIFVREDGRETELRIARDRMFFDPMRYMQLAGDDWERRRRMNETLQFARDVGLAIMIVMTALFGGLLGYFIGGLTHG